MVPVMQTATSMSRFANCAPAKKKGVVARTSTATRAVRPPAHRRRKMKRATAAPVATSTVGRRAAHSWLPSVAMAPAVSQ